MRTFWLPLVLSLVPSVVLAAPPIRVIDGDTIVYGKTHVRLMGLDAPETRRGASGYQCEAERKLGLEAKARLTDIVANSRVTLRWAKGKDKFGRAQAWLYTNADSSPKRTTVNNIMIREGLAKPWDGKGLRHSWCTEGRRR